MKFKLELLQIYWYTCNMPRASKRKLDQKKLKNISSQLTYLISNLSRDSEIEDFLDNFLTREEKIMLSKRLVLFMILKKGYLPSTIKSLLNISYETIRIYQNQLSGKSQIFHEILEKLLKSQRNRDIFKNIEEILKPLDLALKSKTNMKARSAFLSKKLS